MQLLETVGKIQLQSIPHHLALLFILVRAGDWKWLAGGFLSDFRPGIAGCEVSDPALCTSVVPVGARNGEESSTDVLLRVFLTTTAEFGKITPGSTRWEEKMFLPAKITAFTFLAASLSRAVTSGLHFRATPNSV